MAENPSNQSLCGILMEFSDVTSLQGIPFIRNSKRKITKAAWTIVFCGAVCLWLYQSYLVCQEYFARDTTSTVQISHDTLPFPSVTVCNINPLRKTMVEDIGPENLKKLIQNMTPRNSYKMAQHRRVDDLAEMVLLAQADEDDEACDKDDKIVSNSEAKESVNEASEDRKDGVREPPIDDVPNNGIHLVKPKFLRPTPGRRKPHDEPKDVNTMAPENTTIPRKPTESNEARNKGTYDTTTEGLNEVNLTAHEKLREKNPEKLKYRVKVS